MSNSTGMAHHPALDQMETMWRNGSRGKEILSWLEENDYPSVKYKTLSKYGTRYWNDDDFNEDLAEVESLVSDIENYGLGKVSRISVSKTGYNISVSPQSALDCDLSVLPTVKVGLPIKVPKALTRQSKTIVVIPDTQVEPGRPNEHLLWASQYMVDNLAEQNVSVVHIGDHWNMGSLSSYDKGKGAMEGRRVVADLESGNRGFELIDEPIKDLPWDKHFCFGNHEARLSKAIESDIQLEGLLSTDHFVTPPTWQRHKFLEVLEIEGIAFSHYFYNPNTSKPYGDQIDSRLKTIGRSFVMGHQQGLKFGNRYIAGKQQIGIVAGSCLTLDHKVLTADLRYVPLSDLSIGQEIVSFDETVEGSEGRSRRYKTGRIENLKVEKDTVYKITLSNGKVFKATGDHLWLTRTGPKYIWKTTDQLRPTSGNRNGTRLVKCLDEWEDLDTRDSGYLAAIYDGEGCLYQRKTQNGRHTIAQLSFYQKEGRVLEKTLNILENELDIRTLTQNTDSTNVRSVRLGGGLQAIAKMLGSVRPVRLLEKFEPSLLGSVRTVQAEMPYVISIEEIGLMDIMRIGVDAGTMIVEGYAMHNCYPHQENYMGPQGTGYWRGIIILKNVKDGSADPEFISIDQLCQAYTGKPLVKYNLKEL